MVTTELVAIVPVQEVNVTRMSPEVVAPHVAPEQTSASAVSTPSSARSISANVRPVVVEKPAGIVSVIVSPASSASGIVN